MASPSNLKLALIPFENPENLFELPAVMFIDPCGITHLTYPLMEGASIQGESRNSSLGSDLGDDTITLSEGEQTFSKEQAHSSCDTDDDIPLVQMVSKRLRSRLSQQSCRPIAMIRPDAHASLISNPSMRAPVRVTRSVQRTRDAMLLAKSTKITRPVQISCDVIAFGLDISSFFRFLPNVKRGKVRAYGDYLFNASGKNLP
uniref:Uncharacterized protein n=1 Tax=Solanum tuberosum TaxID=4113 RepID=M1DTJ9_SOLTU